MQWENERVALLQQIEQTAFFQKVRGDSVVSLYNQKEVWPKFGYEGSSAEHGGYTSAASPTSTGSSKARPRATNKSVRIQHGKIRSE